MTDTVSDLNRLGRYLAEEHEDEGAEVVNRAQGEIEMLRAESAGSEQMLFAARTIDKLTARVAELEITVGVLGKLLSFADAGDSDKNYQTIVEARRKFREFEHAANTKEPADV